MIFICSGCSSTFLTVYSPEAETLLGRNLWPTGYKCPFCEKPLQVKENHEVPPEVLAAPGVLTLTAQEMFVALSGGGFPDERKCGPDELRKAMVGKQIKSIKIESIPGRDSDRVLLDSLILEDDTVIYLAAGSYGATVYRIGGKRVR